MFFTGLGGDFLSEFHVGDLRPDPGATEYCSAHMGMAVIGVHRDLLVNAWYTGGVENNAIAEGMVVYRTQIQRPAWWKRVDHLNPQTLEE